MSSRLNISDHAGVQRLLDELEISLDEDKFWPRYNISPLTALWGIYGEFERARLSPVEWALIPPWAKPGQFPRPLTIARAETVWERASFKNLIRRYRCIIPANGFYAFDRKKSQRRAWHIGGDTEHALALGGIRQYNADGIMQICILTIEDDGALAGIDDRVPVIVPRDRLRDWLNSDDRGVVDSMLKPPRGGIVINEVTSEVVDPDFESPACIKPL